MKKQIVSVLIVFQAASKQRNVVARFKGFLVWLGFLSCFAYNFIQMLFMCATVKAVKEESAKAKLKMNMLMTSNYMLTAKKSILCQIFSIYWLSHQSKWRLQPRDQKKPETGIRKDP